MRAFCVILFSFLLFTACHRQQVKQTDLTQNHDPLVIDYPAGVMISPQRQASGPSNRNISFAEKILSPHRIPVLDTNMRQLVFVKTNGDRIIIGMDELKGKYDIILFNAVNNPVPLRMADLQCAAGQIFNFRGDNKISRANRQYLAQNFAPEGDTSISDAERRKFTRIRNRDKKIVITTADTATQKFVTRVFPGIQWVEQRLDTRTILVVNFENDLITYANTDRYFTNGITLDLQAAWLSHSAFQRLMVPYRHKALVSYHLSLVQDMYTPADTRVAPTLHNDRPYSSYLYVGFRRTVSDAARKFKMSSQLDVGYLGPYSPGSYLQTLVHKTFPTNDVPLGWETQINTDVILNYTLQVQKALVNDQNFSLLAGMDVKAGTLYTNAGAGLQLRAGKSEPVFGLAKNEKWPKKEYYFFAETHMSFVAYNALLQGGVLNHENVFTLHGNQIRRVVGNARAGIHFRYKGMGIELAQHYLSPEYKAGLWHKWGQISLLFKL